MNLPPNSTRTTSSQREAISRTEFHQRLEILEPPTDNPDQTATHRYLHAVIRLVEERQQHVNHYHPLALKLSALVPDHLPIFLKALNTADHQGIRCLESALYHGVSASQKQEILNHLVDHPQLANLVIARGWIKDAEESLIRLLESNAQSLPLSVFKAVAWLENPATYPKLLATMEQQNSIEYYEILKRISGMKSDLDRSMRRHWQKRLNVLRRFDDDSPRIRLALRHGNSEALKEIYRRMEWINISYGFGSNGLARAIRDNIIMTGLDTRQHHDDVTLMKWFHRFKPGDYQFDTALERFVLKDSSRNQTDFNL